MSKMSNEALLFDEAREKYEELKSYYKAHKDDLGADEMIRNLVIIVNPESKVQKIESRNNPTNLVNIYGEIPSSCGEDSWQFYRVVKLDCPEMWNDEQFNVWIKSLTMAYYQTSGGKLYQTVADLFKEIDR